MTIQQEISTELSFLKADLHKAMQNIQKSIDSRIATTVKSEVIKSEKMFQTQFLKTFNEQIDLGKTLSNEQITKLIAQHRADIDTIKNQSNNYLLGEHLKTLTDRVEDLGKRLNIVSSQMDNLIGGKKYVEIVEPEELKLLYSRSGASPDEMGKFLGCDKSTFYLILNGQEKHPDLLRRHKVKQYFLKKILSK